MISLGLLAAAVALQVQQPQTINAPTGVNGPNFAQIELYAKDSTDPVAYLRVPLKPLDEPQSSPKKFADGQPWKFPWVVEGFVRIHPKDQTAPIRFRVFSQTRDNDHLENDLAVRACKEMLRLWEMNHRKLKIDHAEDIHRQIVDVYLCKGGTPGGEQLFDTEENKVLGKVKVDTIYIYDLPSLNDSLEEAREVAHEYGHAVLPGVSGFKEPEYWANGYLGEKLFLKWLRDEIAFGRLSPADAMGATVEDLDQFVAANVNPLIKAASKRSPNDAAYSKKDLGGMAAYEGLVLWCDAMMPAKMFGRSLLLVNGSSPLDYVNAAVLAAEEATYSPRVSALIPAPFWVPVGDGKVVGAEVLERNSGWRLIKPTGKVKIVAAIEKS